MSLSDYLFADLKGSMELLADRDPEVARKLLDSVVERMTEPSITTKATLTTRRLRLSERATH